MRRDIERGQVLLIVVLVTVTALTVGLSIAARTIINSRSTQDAKNSEQAFTAAEAGIERAMTDNKNAVETFPDNSSYKTTVRSVDGVEFALNNDAPILKDDSIDLWLSRYPNYASSWTGTLTLYWGQQSDICTASESTNTASALEVIVVSGPTNDPRSTKYALDPCNTRSLQNHFTFVSSSPYTINGKTYRYRYSFPITAGLFMRVIPLYAPTVMAVRGCDASGTNCLALPSQGTVIESVGVAEETSRKIVSTKPYPKIPTELFPYSIFIPQ